MIGCVLLKTGAAEIHCVARSCLCVEATAILGLICPTKTVPGDPQSSFSLSPPPLPKVFRLHTHSAKFHFEMMVSNSARGDVAPADGQ